MRSLSGGRFPRARYLLAWYAQTTLHLVTVVAAVAVIADWRG